jgi:prepilin-type N-terminal cleavage/methylation domain-containing protein
VFEKNKKNKGFSLTEIIVASAIIGMLMIGLAISMYGFAKFNRYQLVRQQCTSAAQAQLDSISATGKPIPDEDFERLWPKLSVSIEESAGMGQWNGMRFVEVTASGVGLREKEVKVRLSRYILDNKQ